MDISNDVLSSLCGEYKKYNRIDPADYERYHVKRGLRNEDGTGVMAGLTRICNVRGYIIDDGEKHPVAGKLYYRGIDINKIIAGCHADGHFGFEEVIWLLLFGTLPDKARLEWFRSVLAANRELPEGFAEDMIIKAPSPNIMNKIARSVLALYSYDDNPDDLSVENVLRQSIGLIAKLPTITTYAYQVKRRYYDGQSMFFHPIDKEQTIAEFFLSNLRPDRKFTELEARVIDECLVLHADHGGGNNSAFTSRVLSSSGTDTYATISAAVGSLKGHRHGGANIKTLEMLERLKADIGEDCDEGAIKDYLVKLLRREAGDKTGLVYGMGHAVYTVSDPRAVILKQRAGELSQGTAFENDFRILDTIERLTPTVLSELKGQEKAMCANVDLYSGLVYRTLGIPQELFTPLFAIARVAGWSAHRIEEITTNSKIIRPAYKAVSPKQHYVPLDER